MNVNITRQSAAAVTLWLLVPGAILSFATSLFFTNIYGFIFFALWSVVFVPFCMAYFSTFKLCIGKTHVSLRHGIFFKFTHRMPRAFITGCHIITSPLQRSKNVCILIILCASGFYVVPGISVGNAEKVADILVLRSR